MIFFFKQKVSNLNRLVQNSRSPKHPKISIRKGLQFLL